MLTFEYGNTQNSDHPGPEASIRLSNPDPSVSQSCKVIAIVDSAAGMTCIPESKIDELGNLHYNYIGLRDANGNTQTRKTYRINIEIDEDYIFENIEVIAIPKEYALIGRDILNQNKFMLDATGMRWIYDCPGRCLESNETTGD